MVANGSSFCYHSMQWQQILLPLLQSAFQALGKPATIHFCYHSFQWQQMVAAFATIQCNGSRYCYHCYNQLLKHWVSLLPFISATIHSHGSRWQQLLLPLNSVVAEIATIDLNGNGSNWQQNLLQLQQLNCYHSIFTPWLPGFCNQATTFKTNYID